MRKSTSSGGESGWGAMNRRDFVKAGLVSGAAPFVLLGAGGAVDAAAETGRPLMDGQMLGGLKAVEGAELLEGARWL